VRFAFRHAAAAALVVSGIVAFTAASYFALLTWAVLAGEPIGGPLAFPFMVLFALVASVGCVVLALFPTTIATEWICRTYRLSLVLQIPIASTLLVALVFGVALGVAITRGTSLGAAAWSAAIGSALLLVPLGAYWWALQSTDLLMHLAATGVRWFNGR
jgi:hypothetical protein